MEQKEEDGIGVFEHHEVPYYDMGNVVDLTLEALQTKTHLDDHVVNQDLMVVVQILGPTIMDIGNMREWHRTPFGLKTMNGL